LRQAFASIGLLPLKRGGIPLCYVSNGKQLAAPCFVRFICKTIAKNKPLLCHVYMPSCLLVCLSVVCLFLCVRYTALTGQISVKFYIGDFYSVT